MTKDKRRKKGQKKPKLKKIRQSAVLPFRCGKDGLEILLITSRQSGRWVIPKGMIEPGLNPAKSAEKEGYEEAGIQGDLYKKRLGDFLYEKAETKGEAVYKVDVYPFKVKDLLIDWPEKDERKRKWVSPEEAADMVNENKLKAILNNCQKELRKIAS